MVPLESVYHDLYMQYIGVFLFQYVRWSGTVCTVL